MRQDAAIGNYVMTNMEAKTMEDARVNGMDTESTLPAKATELATMPTMSIAVKNIDIDMEEIKKWIAPQGATAKEIYTFGRICQTLGLSPFKKEIYFIKYGNVAASIVVGYTVYIDRGERSGKLDGWHVEMDDPKNPTEATITIHRKDWSEPFVWTVYRDEVEKLKKDGSPMSTWASQPRFQLMKCAISQGFRLAFPSECGELPYTAEEIGDSNGYLPVVLEPEMPEAQVEGAQAEPDMDYLRGQYFKWANPVFGDNQDARHQWQEKVVGKTSTTAFTPDDYQKLFEFVDEIVESSGTPPNMLTMDVVLELTDQFVAEEIDWRVDEAARLEAELGKDAPEDYVGEEDAEAQPEDVPFVDSKAEKIKLIQDLLAQTPMKSTRTNGYKSWGLKLLGKRAFPIADLSDADLDTLIADLNTQMKGNGQGDLL